MSQPSDLLPPFRELSPAHPYRRTWARELEAACKQNASQRTLQLMERQHLQAMRRRFEPQGFWARLWFWMKRE